MLDLNRPTSAPAGFAAGVAEPVRLAGGQGVEHRSQRFALADEAVAATEQGMPLQAPLAAQAEALPGADELLGLAPANGAPEPSQDSAQQWLEGMLGQRELQVEARDEALSEPALLTEDAAPLLEQPAALAALWSAAANGVAQASAQSNQTNAKPDSVQWSKNLTAASQSANVAAEQPLPASARAQDKQPAEWLMPASNLASSSALGSQPLAHSLSVPLLPIAAEAGQSASLTEALPKASHSLPAAQQRLVLDGPQARWGEQMLYALRDSVDLQLRQQAQNATIRLDPPELGSMEIFLSHESGRLNVQISASNGEVARLLQQTSERLRQELVAANFMQVNVQVGSDSRQSRGQAQSAELWALEPEISGNQSLDVTSAAAAAGALASDVLVTV